MRRVVKIVCKPLQDLKESCKCHQLRYPLLRLIRFDRANNIKFVKSTRMCYFQCQWSVCTIFPMQTLLKSLLAGSTCLFLIVIAPASSKRICNQFAGSDGSLSMRYFQLNTKEVLLCL